MFLCQATLLLAADMIGGGQYLDFYDPGTLEPKFDKFDPELFVRYAQVLVLIISTSL